MKTDMYSNDKSNELRQIFGNVVTDGNAWGDDVYLFDNLDAVAISNKPRRLQNPVFGLCLSGWFKMKVNLEEYDVQKNYLVALMPENVLHGFSHSDDFKGLFLVVSKEIGDEILPDIPSALPAIMSLRQTPVVELTEQEAESIVEFHSFVWKKERTCSGCNRKLILNSLLRGIFYELLQIYRTRHATAEATYSRNDDLFYKFYDLLEKNYKECRSVQYYADRMCLTPKHLSAVVKKVSGRTAGDWIDGYVLLAAKVLLRSSSYTIQEVSRELNFANQSFFGKFFKKHVGLSPSEYRAKGLNS